MAVPPVSMDFSYAPTRSQHERTRREDRHSKFYEISDNLPARSASVFWSWPPRTPAVSVRRQGLLGQGVPQLHGTHQHPARHTRTPPPGKRPDSEISKARIRLVIESVFSNLKRQMRMEEHLAKTTPGLAQRIAQRLLALTLAMLINLQIGRPPRALTAYDGR